MDLTVLDMAKDTALATVLVMDLDTVQVMDQVMVPIMVRVATTPALVTATAQVPTEVDTILKDAVDM